MIGPQAVAMAARSLWGHKVRSLLTILGVVIGIGSVVTVVTLGESFEGFVVGQFDSVDDRSVFVTSGVPNPQGPPAPAPYGTIFTERDRTRIAALPHVLHVDARGAVALAALEKDDRAVPFRLATATSADAQPLRDPEAYAAGGPFRDGAREAVLGAAVVAAFGNGTLAVGDRLDLVQPDGSRVAVRVAGFLKPQDGLLPGSDGNVFVPLDPFYDVRIRSPSNGRRVVVYDALTAVADDPRHLDEVRSDVRSYMEEESDAIGLRTGDLEIFVATAGDITDAIGDTFDRITLVFAIIAVVSLVVGAIGIANIMLVAVAERTREIGIMKAIGALDRQVLGFFLMEAALVGALGSVLGAALGLAGGTALVRLFFGADVPVRVPYGWVVGAVVVGLVVGVLSGLLPAQRATRIQPVEALAYE